MTATPKPALGIEVDSPQWGTNEDFEHKARPFGNARKKKEN